MTHHGNSEPRNRGRFNTTHWSLVLRAAASDSEDGQRALNELIQRYWYPLYAFCRRRGNGDADARDLTQGFFAHLLAGHGLETTSPHKGRFRSFLLTSFKNYMANQHRTATALRRGGSITILSLEGTDLAARYEKEPISGESPELLFERRWVESLLARVLARLADDYRQAGKEALFEMLEPYLLHQGEALPRVEISNRLQLSAAAINMSIHRMRRRYGEILREEVASTVDDRAEIEDEIRALMAVVGQ